MASPARPESTFPHPNEVLPGVRPGSFARAVGLGLLNWLIPGAGYLAAGDRVRGAVLFLLLNGCFAIGLFLDGGILLPDLQSPLRNIVAILTFLVQVFHGGGAIALLALQKAGPDAPGYGILVRNAGATFADLGSFHILVAGGLNYFASLRLFDLLSGRGPADAAVTPVSEPSEASA